MAPNGAAPGYALGDSDREHERLIRQASRLAPMTDRFLRDAGIAAGHRVLDLGSGVGDVAMLAARIVGSSGEVVGLERDSRAIARASARAAEAGVHNVRFRLSDVREILDGDLFDAAIGRLILEFVPDPVAVVRSASQAVRRGGIVAFQEVSWAHLLLSSSHLPLWSASVSLAAEVLRRSGANLEIGFDLHRIFLEAGLTAPAMSLEMPLGADPEFTRWLHDFICSLLPEFQRLDVSLEPIGEVETLPRRLQTEITASRTVVPYIALVRAWSRRD
jgi:ubiquinone/menaquinone biosynthesis C-methylase UbiE